MRRTGGCRRLWTSQACRRASAISCLLSSDHFSLFFPSPLPFFAGTPNWDAEGRYLECYRRQEGLPTAEKDIDAAQQLPHGVSQKDMEVDVAAS